MRLLRSLLFTALAFAPLHTVLANERGTVADISVVLADSPDPIIAGSNLTYTATVRNIGPQAQTGVFVSLPLPAGTAFVSANADGGGSCAGVATVTCTWAAATGAGVDRIATIVVTVEDSTASGTILSATANAGPLTDDPVPANNVASAGSGVITNADLSMALTAAPDPVTAGSNLTYSATLTQGGPSDAQDVSFAVGLPAGVSLVVATPSGGGNCVGTSTITCTWLGATTTGVERTANILVTVAASAAGGFPLAASATASSATPDNDLADNNVNISTTVEASADLLVGLTDNPDPVTAGGNLVYTATVTNNGVSDAQNVQVSLPLPAGTTLISASADGAGSCTQVSPVQCTWAGATAPAITRTATIEISVPSNQPGDLSATATASSSTPDPNLANNDITQGTIVLISADLSLTLSASPDPVIAGTNLTYTAVVNNAGPADGTAAILTMSIPANTSFVSATVSGGGSCAGSPTLVCTMDGNIPSMTSRTLSIVFAVSPAALTGSTINASAEVSAGSPDPVLGNNTANLTTGVITSADLVLVLGASANQALVNVPVTFIATSSNQGPSDAQGVSISITLTPDFRYTSHTAAGAVCTTPQVGNTGVITCTWAGATTPMQVRTLTVVAFSNNEGSTAVAASTTSSTPDPVANNNGAGVNVLIGFQVEGIPSLSQYGLILLGLLFGLVGFAAVRRQG